MLTYKPLHYPKFPSIDATVTAWRALNAQIDNSKPLHKKDIPLSMYEYLIPSLKIDEITFPKNTTYKQFIAKSPLTPSYANIQLHHYHIKNPNTFVSLRSDIWEYST